MKKLFLRTIVCLASVAHGQTATSYDTIQYAKEYHQERLSLFKTQVMVNDEIIFLGNSITEFGNWKQLLKDSILLNRGIAGDNTFGVLKRLEEVIKRKPRKLFLEIGINDISQNIPNAIIVENILAIANRVKAKLPRTEMYVISILPSNDNVKNEYPNAYGKNDRVLAVNEQLKKNAVKNKFVYVDIGSFFKDKQGKLSAQYAAPDGLHINEEGYKKWVRVLKDKNYL
jgi:lysophospholipase L1-like esterase